MTEPAITNVTLLAVDDDADILELLARIFKRHGYTTLQAFDGRQALTTLAANPSVDVVLLDVLMPGQMNGIDVLRAIRADPALRSVPVLLVTALGTTEQLVAGLDAGADDYIAKPFVPRELLARVNAALRLSRGQRALPPAGRDGSRLRLLA